MHILVALVLSLVINFSYLLVPIITDQGMNQRGGGDGSDGEHNTGVLHLSPDMHGYIVCDCEAQDSIYVSAWQVHSMKLLDGDHLCFTTRDSSSDRRDASYMQGAHKRLDDVQMRNGESYDFDAIYDRPSRTVEFVWQIVYYALISFVLLMLLTIMPRSGNYTNRVFARRMLIVLLISVVGICFAPVMSFRDGFMRIVFFFQAEPHNNVYLIVLTKCLFMLVVTLLYARIYMLMRQRQTMEVENERLKTENLSTRYNMLVGQINPHFFFNSLNSLAMLVREGDEQRALEYIDQLSYTFRYIIQNGQSGTTTLRDEIAFAEAYAYLFKIRYADKLFFDFDIDDKYALWRLPGYT